MQAIHSHQKKQFPRLKFISNFQLYHGLSKFYTQMRLRSIDRCEMSENEVI